MQNEQWNLSGELEKFSISLEKHMHATANEEELKNLIFHVRSVQNSILGVTGQSPGICNKCHRPF